MHKSLYTIISDYMKEKDFDLIVNDNMQCTCKKEDYPFCKKTILINCFACNSKEFYSEQKLNQKSKKENKEETTWN